MYESLSILGVAAPFELDGDFFISFLCYLLYPYLSYMSIKTERTFDDIFYHKITLTISHLILLFS